MSANKESLAATWKLSSALAACSGADGSHFCFFFLPAQDLPTFGVWDILVKKGGHLLGYGLLALSYWFALRWQRQHFWTAFFLTVLYAVLDEWHQAFVPGRNASWFDALVIDAGGAFLALYVARRNMHAG